LASGGVNWNNNLSGIIRAARLKVQREGGSRQGGCQMEDAGDEPLLMLVIY